MIKGITVTLHEKVETGKDGFNHPIYEEITSTVDNALVAPTSSTDMINSESMDGITSTYTIAIPKGDAHDWTDARVEFFGQSWQVVGEPLEGIEEMLPLSWNKKVTVMQYGK